MQPLNEAPNGSLRERGNYQRVFDGRPGGLRSQPRRDRQRGKPLRARTLFHTPV